MADFEQDVTAVGALADATRRALYDYVCGQSAPVGRDAAAAALDLPRHQAKFHLDRLTEVGLLTADYVRLTGKSGPGAGRPSKVYRRAHTEVSVELPQRQYQLAAELMAGAIQDSISQGIGVGEALRFRSRQAGADLAASIPPGVDPLPQAAEKLAALGYEPRDDQGRLTMANCPFHALAAEHTELVCGLNHELLDRFCACAGGLNAELDPQPGRCCVTISRA